MKHRPFDYPDRTACSVCDETITNVDQLREPCPGGKIVEVSQESVDIALGRQPWPFNGPPSAIVWMERRET